MKTTILLSSYLWCWTWFAFRSWFALRVVVGGIDQVFKLLHQGTQTVVHLLHLWHWGQGQKERERQVQEVLVEGTRSRCLSRVGVCLHLTDEVLGVLWSHHIQSQGLQVPVLLLEGWILKIIAPAFHHKEWKQIKIDLVRSSLLLVIECFPFFLSPQFDTACWCISCVQQPVFEAELGDDLLHLVHLTLRGRWALGRIQSPNVVGVRQVDDVETWRGHERQHTRRRYLLKKEMPKTAVEISKSSSGVLASFVEPSCVSPEAEICTFPSSSSSFWGTRATNRGGMFRREMQRHKANTFLSWHFVNKAENRHALPEGDNTRQGATVSTLLH